MIIIKNRTGKIDTVSKMLKIIDLAKDYEDEIVEKMPQRKRKTKRINIRYYKNN